MDQNEAKIPDWVKDIDIGRSIENLLMGIILFFGRLIKTTLHFLCRPKMIESDVLSIIELKDTYKITYVRPLVFFVVVGFVSIAFSYKSLNQLPFVDWLFDRYGFLSSGINTEASKFSLAAAAGAMVPTVLVVALYALVSQNIFSRFHLDSNFKPHLAICCYTSGMLFMMLMFANMYEMHIWAEPDNDTFLNDQIRPAIGLFGMVGSALMACFVIYRYFYYLHVISNGRMVKVLAAAAVSASVFWALFLVLGLLIDPILESVS